MNGMSTLSVSKLCKDIDERATANDLFVVAAVNPILGSVS